MAITWNRVLREDPQAAVDLMGMANKAMTQSADTLSGLLDKNLKNEIANNKIDQDIAMSDFKTGLNTKYKTPEELQAAIDNGLIDNSGIINKLDKNKAIDYAQDRRSFLRDDIVKQQEYAFNAVNNEILSLANEGPEGLIKANELFRQKSPGFNAVNQSDLINNLESIGDDNRREARDLITQSHEDQVYKDGRTAFTRDTADYEEKMNDKKLVNAAFVATNAQKDSVLKNQEALNTRTQEILEEVGIVKKGEKFDLSTYQKSFADATPENQQKMAANYKIYADRVAADDLIKQYQAGADSSNIHTDMRLLNPRIAASVLQNEQASITAATALNPLEQKEVTAAHTAIDAAAKVDKNKSYLSATVSDTYIPALREDLKTTFKDEDEEVNKGLQNILNKNIITDVRGNTYSDFTPQEIGGVVEYLKQKMFENTQNSNLFYDIGEKELADALEYVKKGEGAKEIDRFMSIDSNAAAQKTAVVDSITGARAISGGNSARASAGVVRDMDKALKNR